MYVSYVCSHDGLTCERSLTLVSGLHMCVLGRDSQESGVGLDL